MNTYITTKILKQNISLRFAITIVCNTMTSKKNYIMLSTENYRFTVLIIFFFNLFCVGFYFYNMILMYLKKYFLLPTAILTVLIKHKT